MIKKINFLSDKPLEADYEQNDRFGHSGIAENLKQIIINCPSPFTVGLFGKWGTGKTSIINNLKKRLNAGTKKIPMVIFDVWKHEGDAFRKTFLKDVVFQLKEQGLLSDYKLTERIDTSIAVTKNVRKIDKITGGVSFILLLLMIVVGVVLYILDKNDFAQYFSIITSGSLVTILLVWLFNRIVITEDLTRSQDRFTDPHEFERQFFDIIKTTKAQRLLIAIDNLDRCTRDWAVNLLSVIKTFLANDSDQNCCIFLITCDDKAIKKHLEHVYGTNQEDFNNADEFLRKFFNVSLTLPDFIDTELYKYTKEMLTYTNIPQFNSPDLVLVIITAFRENPRQIKQFINILIAHFLLAEKRENENTPLIVPKGAISDNAAFLAKFLVIRQKYHNEYERIITQFLPPEVWNKIETDKNSNFKNFHTATNMITVRDIRPFIYLKQSDEELLIPGLRQIERGLIECDIDLLFENLKGLSETGKMGHFNTFLLGLLRQHKDQKSSLVNIFESSLLATNKLKIELDKEFYRHLGHLLNDPDGLYDRLYQFTPFTIFNEFLVKCEKNNKKKIIEHFVEYFCLKRDMALSTRVMASPDGGFLIGRNFAFDILKELIKSDIEDNQKNRIKTAIENYYSDDEFLSLFIDNIHKNEFISENTLVKYVSNFKLDIDNNTIEPLSSQIQIFLKFKEVIADLTTEAILNKLQSILDVQNKISLKQMPDVKENLFKQIEIILIELNDKIKNNDKAKVMLNIFADKIIEGFNLLVNWEERKIMIFSCLLTEELLEGKKKRNIIQLVKSFFVNGSLSDIQYVFDNKRLTSEQKSILIDQYNNELKPKAISNQELFDYFYPLGTKDTKTNWLIDLINTFPNRAVEKINNLECKTENDPQVVITLLQKVVKLPINEKNSVYKIINKMKCANDEAIKNILNLQLKNLLVNTDKQAQEVGYESFKDARSYLTGATKREIGTEVINWLRSPELSDPYQWNSIKSVLITWEDLPNPLKNNYIYFVFYKIIIPKSNVENIRSGFQILQEINIDDDGDNQKYLDDVFLHIESESNENIKKETINGLISIKPSIIKKDRNEFWKKVEELNKKMSPSS